MIPPKPKPKRSPIVEFLGEDAGIGGPFALLGLLHDITSDEQIVRACNRRLAQIDRHRHRSTPDAGEVRLAVHAAASQLLDPMLRAELARRWPEGTPISVPKAWKPANAGSRLTPGFLHNAKLLIAASGGWNATARKRLAHFARVNRVTALELVRALRPIQTSTSTQTQPKKSTSDDPLRLDDRVYLVNPPPRQSWHWFAAYTLVLIMGMLVVSTIVIAPPSIHSRSSTSDGTASQRDPRMSIDQGSGFNSQTDITNQRQELVHYTAIAHELDQLAARAKSEPELSIERFATIYPLFVEQWTAFPEPALKRTSLHIAQIILYTSQAEPAMANLMSILACDSSEDDPSKLIIRAAAIDVALSTPGLNTKAIAQLSSIHARCIANDPRPTPEIMEALITVSGLVGVETRTDEPRWWQQWIQSVEVITKDDESQRIRLVLSAMSARLRDPAPAGEPWNRATIELVNAISWRGGSPGRYWLLSQFADALVSTPRLAALTNALATQSGAKEITAQMVLNPSSTFLQRQKLAQTYRSAWTSSTSSASGAHRAAQRYKRMIDELHIRVSITPVQMDERQSISAIIELARLNTAAWQFADGLDAIAADTLAGAGEPVAEASKPELLMLSMNRRDIQWAEDAINANDAVELGVLSARLFQDGGPGVNSAYALVFLATLHADSEIRVSASAQIVRYKDRPSVLLALDHAISSSRITTRLDQLVVKVVGNPLPSRTSDAWYDQAHRVLLDRLGSSLAKTIETPLPVLEASLAMAYRDRVLNENATIENSLGGGWSANDQAQRIYHQLILDARLTLDSTELSLDDIARVESSTQVRLARAQSPLQRFLAYQRGIGELLAIMTIEDVPGSSLQVRELLDELARRLDQSSSAIEQIAQAERCIAQIWIIRLEGATP